MIKFWIKYKSKWRDWILDWTKTGSANRHIMLECLSKKLIETKNEIWKKTPILTHTERLANNTVWWETFTISCVTSRLSRLPSGISLPSCDRSGPADVRRWWINAVTYLLSASYTPSREGMQVKTPLSTSLLYTFSTLYTRLLMHTQKIYGLCAHKRLWFHVCLRLFTHRRQKRIWNILRQFNKLPQPSPSGGDETWRRSHKVLWHFKNQLTYQHRKEIKFYCGQIEKFRTYRRFWKCHVSL